MSLLRLLNLPIPKSLLVAPAIGEARGAQANGVAVLDHPHVVGAPQGQGASGAGPGPAVDPMRAEAAKMHGVIEAKRKEAQATLDKLEKVAPVLQQMTDAATGDKKKELLAKQAALAKKTADTEREVHEAVADLEAIDNPGARREELVSIMARHRSAGQAASHTEVDVPGLEPDKKHVVNKDTTTTTTAYDKGKATVETTHDKRHVGVGGYDAEHSHEKIVQTANLTQRTSDEKKTHVSITGKASVEKTHAVEVELPDGRTSKLEHKDAKEISAKGASHEQTVTKTNFDGSGSSTTKKNEVERGEGKVTATTSKSVTTTSATGTAKTTDRSASGGMIAGKDGIGAQGGIDGGKSVTSKGGRQAGVVGGLHASVVCNIGEPKGEPKMYPVSLTVTFGASAGVSAGAGKKEGSNKSASVEVSGSVEASMTVTHQLTEDQLGNYEKNLQAASKGSKVAATEAEFAIIAAGSKGNWGLARNLRSAMLGQITAKTADQVKNVGDSVAMTQTKTGKVAANATIGPVSVGGSVKVVDEQHKKVTRTDKTTLDVDGGASHTKETSKSLGLKTGAFEVTVGTVTTHTSSFGYVIEIDDKNDPGHKMLAELGKCATEKQYQAFLAKYKGKVNFVSHTVATKDGERDQTGVNVGGKGLSWGTGQSTSVEETRDGKGKLMKKTVVGEETAGGAALIWHDEQSEKATAVIDGDGNAELTLRRQTSGNDSKKQLTAQAKNLAAKVGIGSKEPKKATGALTTATGGAEEETPHEAEGLGLNMADLKKIAHVAMNSQGAWMEATRRWQEKDDWLAACNAIRKAGGTPAATAEALARFVGGDRVYRMKMLELWLRGGYHQRTGNAFEFPESLGDIEDLYNDIVSDKLPGEMDELRKAKGNPAALAECVRYSALASQIEPRLRKCADFKNEQVKTEMLSRLTNRQALLTEAIAGFGGMGKKAAVDPKVLEDKCNRLTQLCRAYYHEQNQIAQEMDDQDTGTVTERIDGRKLIKKMEDMHLRWWDDYHLLQDAYEKRGMKTPEDAYLRPGEKLVPYYEKKFGDS